MVDRSTWKSDLINNPHFSHILDLKWPINGQYIFQCSNITKDEAVRRISDAYEIKFPWKKILNISSEKWMKVVAESRNGAG